MLSVLPALNYRPWFALAEFVDNSVQSYALHRKELNVDRLRVDIEYDPSGDSLVVRDNAGGINRADFARAFRAGERPVDRTGLSEFGMGMKSAAFWFGRRFSVRTSALGEAVERTLTLDLEEIVKQGHEILVPKTRAVPEDWHYTEVTVSALYNPPQKRTIGKMKEHLASIYRVFDRDGSLLLRWNKEQLFYEEPPILRAAWYKDEPDAEPVVWKKDISFDLGKGLSVHGFAAIRQVASTALAGFALFRRGRLVEGSADETYRPRVVFGASNDYVYQRLFGELHLEGFQVSHTKDGFRWDENEEPCLELLKDELETPPLRLITQAREYRVRARVPDVRAGAIEAVERTVDALTTGVGEVAETPSAAPEEIEAATPSQLSPSAATAAQKEFRVELHDRTWEVTLDLVSDPGVGDWLTVSDDGSAPLPSGGTLRRIGVRMNLAHPFMDRFSGTSVDQIEPLLRVAAGLAISETLARESGIKLAGVIRMRLNELLRGALSRP